MSPQCRRIHCTNTLKIVLDSPLSFGGRSPSSTTVQALGAVVEIEVVSKTSCLPYWQQHLLFHVQGNVGKKVTVIPGGSVLVHAIETGVRFVTNKVNSTDGNLPFQ